MPLNLDSLQKSINALSLAIEVEKGDFDSDTRVVLRAGVIQSFEFTQEMSWKMIRRWLNSNISPSVADGIDKRELFRLGIENGLISDFKAWVAFQEARNKTSHIYSEKSAESVYIKAKEFLPYARELLKNLQERNS